MSNGTHLIHSSVCEKKSWVVIRDGGGGRDESMVLGTEVLEEGIADLARSPGAVVWFVRH